ncbi:LITAF domain-containing protein [Caenorhabditis elegans]|uniref:LITAF domain-containing protein n=1 Tax=Caenorhabditis elegans TaxID=6239 RepID=O62039_CAEEL|nr:LITAF domain-containing protein [Caenorhabditis elegans]CAB03856.2 LITAF domain-containing protein [Caenorhabditis elegans]|eukprot:NP_507591.2 Uncharacterized protein CELE_C08E8.1 [Caenorhabditis elegans]
MNYPEDFQIPHVIKPVKSAPYVVKETPLKTSFLTYCPTCEKAYMTSVNTHIGVCWWLICFFGTVLCCFPFLFFLCCDVSKDVNHNCPSCGMLLAKKNRAGFK